MRLPWRRDGDSGTTRLACQRCSAAYAPALTRGDCPVCGLTGDASWHPSPADTETRPMVLAITAMAVNLVVFALVTWAVLG